MAATDASLLATVDARTKLAGSNKMEILLFSLGTRETFGINVFKVREVSQTPAITKTPNMPFGVEGVLSLRGNIIPVISLGKFIGADQTRSYETMIVTEFNKSTQAFLVDSVDRIIRVDWDKVRAPENMMAASGTNQNLITAITELENGKLVSILDVEQILASVVGEPRLPDVPTAQLENDQYIFFVDDSVVARKEITGVLEKMGIKFQQATNGREAWDRLQTLANRNFGEDECLHDHLKIILVDAEMPEMDGYVLTKLIKSDQRFRGIPVVMHSSLSSNANRAMGSSVGVDAYVAKFDPGVLAETLIPFLQR
ncbi:MULTISPECIES: chemotaxis protein [Chromobacterium]|uniref:Chemotaxis protein CheV n=3 Tax=Chromobacterium TaxID=535 RepID=A0ABS3GMT4_9NEIS|nr:MULTISPECIES: chemotaxis protein [Chromobacterium]AXT45560.1 chemotaxis signal transduction protein CheV [Chromobacterium rhizoryzae]KMN79941.1 chemotaxis protein CheY [Chromobacterium sp. LK11]MBK0414454.1 chemotaxis protein CheV [Chromobacterium haemolyticum]MBN3005633.1 chemotaxis protein CheV [Chromobacterium alkanivorans]MBO0415912.1 chemotaxis protein CheV [Chromobacterium haemolyticum]